MALRMRWMTSGRMRLVWPSSTFSTVLTDAPAMRATSEILGSATKGSVAHFKVGQQAAGGGWTRPGDFADDLPVERLFEIEGLSGEEIATRTGTKVATVWVQLHRGRARFLTRLRDMEKRGSCERGPEAVERLGGDLQD
jgi:hypothetical protein